MVKNENEPGGMTPEQWQERLDKVADEPELLAQALDELDHEMRLEKSWINSNPTPGALFKTIIRFFKGGSDDLQALGEQIHQELYAERSLKDRYRGWLPGEGYLDRLFPYLKNFPGQVEPDRLGLQFPGYAKYKGINRSDRHELFAFFLNQRFPGRAPANFQLTFHPKAGELIIERVYRMELPRIPGISTVGRGVCAELINDLIPKPEAMRLLVIDNAANLETRESLMVMERSGDEVNYSIRPGCEPLKTPLGHLMVNLAQEMGYDCGQLKVIVQRFGVLKIELPVHRL